MRPFNIVILMVGALALCACSQLSTSQMRSTPTIGALEIAAELYSGPGNITLTPKGDLIVSLHQFYDHDIRVARVTDDEQLISFAGGANLNSVLGLQADANGVVWLLDNAMRDGRKRRLVGWHAFDNRMVADIDLTTVTTDGSFLNDLAVDYRRKIAYIADPAGGADAAIIVVDLAQGNIRRLLEGHNSVIPEDIDLVIDGTPVRIRGEDGAEIRPRVGVNPIAIDKNGDWMYYGPMHGRSMYRVRTEDLRNLTLPPEELAVRVERWSEKPICDGISIDDAGNLYLGDLANNAIGVIDSDRKYRILIKDSRLSWVDAFSFGPDGHLYLVVNQLHRSAVLNGGRTATVPPYLILKFKPFANGTPGR